jgi:hypothetical protein
MKAVTSALASRGGHDSGGGRHFFRAIETSDFERRSKEAEDGLSRNSGAAPAVWRRAELSTVK